MSKLGIIVGRFQAPSITAGHRHLIEKVLERDEIRELVILVGTTKGGYNPSPRNPLPFEAVKSSIQEALEEFPTPLFSKVKGIFKIEDVGDWSLWVKKLDSHIESLRSLGAVNSDLEVCVFGSRDSIVGRYKAEGGEFEAEEISECSNFGEGTISGTSAREFIARSYKPKWDQKDRNLLVWFISNFFKNT